MKKLFALIALASGTVFAQTNLPFNGAVSTSCDLNVTRNGTLVVATQNPSIMGTSSPGVAGTVSVSYTGTPTVVVELPTSFDASPTLSFTPTFSTTVASQVLGMLTEANNEATGTYQSGGSDDLTVNMTISAGGSDVFPVGNYAAKVVVTCS
jgi:hypothetical protein